MGKFMHLASSQNATYNWFVIYLYSNLGVITLILVTIVMSTVKDVS